jgi:hypothetical protein
MLTRTELLVMIGTMVLGAALLAAGAAHAQQRPQIGLTPQPKIGAACPTGYQVSGGACVPGPNTSCRAFPKTGATCPVGYTTSFDYCVETGCSSSTRR